MPWTPGRPVYTTRQRHTILATHPTCQCAGCTACTAAGCNRPSTEADHKIPISQGGPNTLTNSQALCHNCHWQKTRTEAATGRNRWKRQPEPHPGIITPRGDDMYHRYMG